ncbi:Epoxyqueuosine reductase [Maioricimonas rarisocia]|uniref:Epoxyqueuosine reductase n=1 Tax=Maioricimonas rarisocia TaxID=2528026 RepID=A0A517Z1H8_9PLAN|nr:SCP2 sterol-binding domain-containing protein [Maioricimonas rarisocia]QDU36324.1 Epoxyqueuosine reductase [Maioricimonas rarisocia]
MNQLAQHPTVQTVRAREQSDEPREAARLPLEDVRQLCLDSGADDAGVVSIDRPELDDQRDEILAAFPRTRTLVSIVCRMNREPVRSPARSVANLEFHHTGERVNEVTHRIVSAFEQRGLRAINPSMGFPMEMDRFPGRIWVVSHKPVAVAAGLGQMGIHRNVIHPKFGNFILLGTVLLEAEVEEQTQPIDYNPCLECKLCVAACPVGAIAPDGAFDFSACYTHNYREFMGGFTDWVENIAESRSRTDYRNQVTDSESASMWQSLSFGANYKAAYCMAVCPAGEDVISPFLDQRKQFLGEVVRPLQEKEEPIYVVPGSDAEEHVTRRFPHKTPRHVGKVLRPTSITGFLESLPHVFQRGKAGDLAARYHFTFTGEEPAKATIDIRERSLEVNRGHVGTADLHVTADSRTWVRFVRGEANLIWALLRRKIRIKGDPRLLKAFGRCFP